MPGRDDVRADRVAEQRPQRPRIRRVADRLERRVRADRIVAEERPQHAGVIGREHLRRGGHEPGHHRRHADRSGHGQSPDDGRRQHGRVVRARHRAVPPGPADGDPVGGVALLRDLDRVQADARDRRGDAAALVEAAGRPQPLGPMLGDPLRAGEATGLLVGGAGEQDVAPKSRDRVPRRVQAGRPGLARQQADDTELHRDHVLHVDRAAAVDVAVGDLGLEWIVAPAIGRRRHDVEVREQQERLAACAVAAQPHVDRPAPGHGLDDLRPETLGLEQARDVARRGKFLVRAIRGGRVDRRDPDEVAERRDERIVGRRPCRVVEPSGWRGDGPGHAPEPMSARTAPTMNPPRISTRTMPSRSRP